MTAPTKYTRQQNFQNDQNANQTAPFNGTHLDSEFNAVQQSNNAIADSLAIIQRSDGQLNNGIVTMDSLSLPVISKMASGATTTDIVSKLALSTGAAGVGFSPSGTLTKQNLQDELAEIDTLKAATSDLANASNGKGVDLIANAAKKVASIAALRALRVPQGSDAQTVIVDGYYSTADGGGGTFIWSPTATNADDGGTVINPTSNAGPGRWLRLFSGAMNIMWFGAKADANYQSGANWFSDSACTIPATDNLSILLSALNSLKAYQSPYPLALAGRVYVPAGNYYFSNTIELHHTVVLTGDNIGQAGTPATIFHYPPNTTGLIIQRANTTGLTGTLTQGMDQADGSEIANIAFVGNATGTTGHGVAIRARANIHDCQISYFKQDGLHIVADSGGVTDPLGNANNWRASNLRINNNGGNGVYVKGADTNAGYAELIDVSNNGGWGISDNSFLGNTWVACHAAGNTSGPYQTTNNNAQSLFLGCYSEGGQPASSIAYPSLMIGGLQGSPVTGTYIGTNLGQVSTNTGMQSAMATGTGSNTLTARVGGNAANGDFLYFSETANFPSALRFKEAGVDAIWNYNNGFGNCLLTGPNTGYQFGRGVAVPLVWNYPSLWLGQDNNARAITCAAAAPTTGTYARGDIVFSNAPSASGSMGWQCVTAGTPGVWKAMPNLSA